jgi:hypothetical protein
VHDTFSALFPKHIIVPKVFAPQASMYATLLERWCQACMQSLILIAHTV